MSDSHKERIRHIDYKFDIVELKRIYEEVTSDPTRISSWPWRYPDINLGRETVGWHYPKIQQMYDGLIPWPYEYIKELAYIFNFKNTGFMFFMNIPYFNYPIHFDSTKGKPTDAGYEKTSGSVGEERTRAHGIRLGLSSDGVEQYVKLRAKGTECAVLVKLEEDNAPLYFTHENQKDWDPPYTKSPKDHKYHYKACLANTHWTHYLEGTDKRRLIFRLSIYGESFQNASRLISTMYNHG
jgi:hypothetical protein|tara:strand:- start:1329 stop:2045 length:717 start_codon:yes stop_codon:yes gene_type:complete